MKKKTLRRVKDRGGGDWSGVGLTAVKDSMFFFKPSLRVSKGSLYGVRPDQISAKCWSNLVCSVQCAECVINYPSPQTCSSSQTGWPRLWGPAGRPCSWPCQSCSPCPGQGQEGGARCTVSWPFHCLLALSLFLSLCSHSGKGSY